MRTVFQIIAFVLLISACTKETEEYPGLRKLTDAELIKRAKDNNWPDINKVVYVMNQDTIGIDSIQKLNYHEIAFDDYVDANGEVVLAVVRTITDKDREVRKKMKEVSKADDLDGQLKTISLYSSKLMQERSLTLYQPNKGKSNIYFYMTDGNIVEDIIKSVNTLIQNQTIIPINIVGVHSDPENRYKEYVNKIDHKDHFDNHYHFFLNEVPGEVENGKGNKALERYLFGFSNGADFCNYIGVNNPKWAKKILAMSGVAYFPTNVSWEDLKSDEFPNFILSSGIEEERSFQNENLKNILCNAGAEVEYYEHPGGHEYVLWKSRLLEFIKNESMILCIDAIKLFSTLKLRDPCASAGIPNSRRPSPALCTSCLCAKNPNWQNQLHPKTLRSLRLCGHPKQPKAPTSSVPFVPLCEKSYLAKPSAP